ncbi:PqqD family protein [Verrucomicrobium spinosum]|uniref:PqqD family protein n=1 Tax=Verrucomicrobium spinosum TaxID=2736 RepID=UPI0001744701|nr:PqqD family protein [Verrucomicrobium spinosum]
MSPRYRLNEPDVSAEVFDEEVLAINLKTGHYHSLRESSIFLWQTLMQGFSIEETASRLTSKYPEIAAQALAETETFAKHLVEGGLVVEAPDATSSADVPPAEPAGKPFVSPLIESYTDMQDLLLIDPIHEVDVQTGWPQKPAS